MCYVGVVGSDSIGDIEEALTTRRLQLAGSCALALSLNRRP
jgi:hypothetical protein